MGIFDKKKTIYVSSVVYNMAGDEFKRPNYLKTTVLGTVINDAPAITQPIVDSYLNGPGMRFRSFHRWADYTDYNDRIGLVTGSINSGDSIDAEVVAEEVPAPIGSIVALTGAKIGYADFSYWADQYVAENSPEDINTNYVSDFNDATGTITITWADNSFTTFTPDNFDKQARYLYAIYNFFTGEETQPLVTGTTVTLNPGDSFPSTVGWDLVSFTTIGTDTHGVWERTSYEGNIPGEDGVYSLHEIMYQDTIGAVRTWRIDEEEIWHGIDSGVQVYIYKQYTGNAVLDAMFLPNANMLGFFPIIPFRIDNKFLSPEFLPDIYTASKKGYKKATTGKYDELIDEMKENAQIGDIDYAYIVFGVCLNVLEQTSRKYIYKFFEEILNDYTQSGEAEFNAFQTAWNAARASWDTWIIWRQAQDDSGNPLYGTPSPARLAYPVLPVNEVNVRTAHNPVINYDMTVRWGSMTEVNGTGLAKPGASADQLWFTKGASQVFDEVIWGNGGPINSGSETVDTITLNWQVTANTWRKLTLVGLKHINNIYGGKVVEIGAHAALDDPEESGFIIPLHNGVFRAMGMVDGTQMTTACCYMVLNCYQVVKQKWYQTTLFQIILVIIAIVIIVVTWGAGTPAVAQGMAAYFAAAGIGTTMAIILAATIYVVGAMIVAKIITAASVKVFGEKWGVIIGMIVSMIAMNYANAAASGASMASSFSGMMSAQNIMALASAVGDGYAAYMRAAAGETMLEVKKVEEQAAAESRSIRNAWEANLGVNGGVINPLHMTDAFAVVFMEKMDSFLQRTLMTGGDVVELSTGLLTHFADMTLNTDLPT